MTVTAEAAAVVVTTRRMRKAVAQWLKEDKATIEQALKLESALYAGLVDGSTYAGRRLEGEDDPFPYGTDFYGARRQGLHWEPDSEIDYPDHCGCLLDTLERIKGGRPKTKILGYSQEAFNLALTIELGDTPSNSKWVRAAVKGIQDYVAEKEASNG